VRTGKVYRWVRDFRGDAPTGNPIHPDNYIGAVENIIYGSATSQRVGGRTETVSTEGMIGCTGVPLKSGDRIVVGDSVKLVVVGDPQWDYPNLFTGTESRYQWVAVESVT
jgi:regulator of RNase E activity RraA